MGEFLVDETVLEDKQMGESAASNPSLQVSVSFGRFENDSLSWERWSSFSPNKYLEEVEKCATPGSVAQKKAYFEAHYKKVAARKAELLAQEKQREKDSFGSQDQSGIDLSGNTDAELDVSTTQGSNEGVQQEQSSAEIHRTIVNDFAEQVAVSSDYQSSSVEVENKEPETRSHSHSFFQIYEPEDVCTKQEENPNIEAEDVKEISHVVYKETGKASEIEAKDVKLDHPKESKVKSVNRVSNAVKTKKKSELPTAKAPQISTPRSSKPAPTPTKTVTPTSSTKKGNSPSLTRRQIASSGESRKVANKSLHMSMSLAPSNPDPAPHTTMRRSLIMEKMGDKDIVKRAFKTFQNSFNQQKSSGEDRSLIKKQVPSRGTVSKVPTSTALRKENGRPTKVESLDKSGNVVRNTLGPKSNIRAEKGKESSRKIEEKSNTKGVERMRPQSKLKEEKEAEMKKLKHNVKGTPLPAFYRGQKVVKSRPEKGDAKT
ncbi:protein WVD2-like 7 isoform X1 [Cajanus cajan]|uniref:protein WVD2-like 7 isoform X1 n=1 Tax=Cajanus cajan TaxID=3821 RepID=UPI0010FB1F65|nr:protein WVD2-like 7 isoform X1 [Cajanus cajan]XP_029127425.1 protein WVD2-like 7 isoform X1 [Cajanus cajan]XP_029127426.1 protein WVD2-like 7 isoform X1 [Cajanus cajan]XP_029127427.1 protein WVD2-like 7 isoform X1 [Cajanus cajan]XP_029127428.1 protein WVD2-like 7 isoform X1 [Cajanus cajan]XP_029127429.1 protein WVD2-like 7 isoform X1 [Cajanus cajan]